MVDSIARRVVEKGYTAVLAPTHYIESANSPWLEVDVRSTRQLRRCLDSANFLFAGGFVRSVPDRGGAPGHPRSAEKCAHRLPVDQGFAKRRVDACRSKASGERGCRLALARRASRRRHDGRAARDQRTGIRSVCHGVTQKERFNARSWTGTENSGNPGFTWAPMIYVALLDMHLKRNEAEAFFEARGSKSRFGCRQRNCCPKGVKDMLDNPVRHSLVQRWGEIRRLSDVPEHLRAQRFLEENSAPSDGCGGVLGVAVVRRGRRSGQTDEPEQEGCRAPPGWLGEFRAGESGRFVLEDTPASGATRLRPDPSREVRYQ